MQDILIVNTLSDCLDIIDILDSIILLYKILSTFLLRNSLEVIPLNSIIITTLCNLSLRYNLNHHGVLFLQKELDYIFGWEAGTSKSIMKSQGPRGPIELRRASMMKSR